MPVCPSLPPGSAGKDYEPAEPGFVRLSGFISKPELQKLNRNSTYIFANGHFIIRDRLILHALSEAYRNIIPPTSFPVVLLFLELPPQEVDVNVHPAKTEVRFRQQSFVHDFVRDSVRTALMKARPAASFYDALNSAPTASALGVVAGRRRARFPGAADALRQQPYNMPPQSEGPIEPGDFASFRAASAYIVPPSAGRLGFGGTRPVHRLRRAHRAPAHPQLPRDAQATLARPAPRFLHPCRQRRGPPGSSISMSPTSASCSKKSCATAPWKESSASAS